jgi:hypothetical protein
VGRTERVPLHNLKQTFSPSSGTTQVRVTTAYGVPLIHCEEDLARRDSRSRTRLCARGTLQPGGDRVRHSESHS